MPARLYRTLVTGAELAVWMNDITGLNTTWTTRSLALKTAINTYCWDNQYGAFKDNATSTTLHPQDANSMAVLFEVVSLPRATNISEKLTENWSPIGAVSPELPDNISPIISSFKIQAHFSIGRADRALDLIRRSWGWYINNPNGTESTVIEGYLANGSFGYRGDRGYDFLTSYVSHSHGWSSGPTAALTNFILGIDVTGRLGETWSLKPQFGDLKTAEGGFTTELGAFWASWEVKGEGQYDLEFEMPRGTVGFVVLPGNGDGVVSVVRDGVGVDLVAGEVDGGLGFSGIEGGSRYEIHVA